MRAPLPEAPAELLSQIRLAEDASFAGLLLELGVEATLALRDRAERPGAGSLHPLARALSQWLAAEGGSNERLFGALPIVQLGMSSDTEPQAREALGKAYSGSELRARLASIRHQTCPAPASAQGCALELPEGMGNLLIARIEHRGMQSARLSLLHFPGSPRPALSAHEVDSVSPLGVLLRCALEAKAPSLTTLWARRERAQLGRALPQFPSALSPTSVRL